MSGVDSGRGGFMGGWMYTAAGCDWGMRITWLVVAFVCSSITKETREGDEADAEKETAGTEKAYTTRPLLN